MKPRERVLKTLEHVEPDRVPMDLGGTRCTTLTLGAYEKLLEHLGLKLEPRLLGNIFQTVALDEEVARYLQVDTRMIHDNPPKKSPDKWLSDDVFKNEWGIVYKRSINEKWFYYDIIEHPLKNATLRDLSNFDWPDPYDPGRTEGLKEEARRLHEETDYCIIGNIEIQAIFATSWRLRGFEQFLIDTIANIDFAKELLARVTEIQKARYQAFLEAVGDYIDLVFIGDDLATQQAPLVSPRTYREIIKPYQADYFEFVKKKSGKKLIYHCCGNVRPLIEDFIEIGVDVLNPVQVSAKDMDPVELKEQFGDRITFWGGIDTQHVLSRGTPDDVRQETKKRINQLGKGGGYVLAAVHNIQFEVPPENILALFETGLKEGKYPL